MVDCRNCQRFGACYFDNEDCIGFEPKPMTNADRIRSMTDEEMAEWMAKYCERKTVCPNFGAHDCQASCKQCWLGWLKEVKE